MHRPVIFSKLSTEGPVHGDNKKAMGHGTSRKTHSVRLEVEQLEARQLLSVSRQAVANLFVHSPEHYAFVVNDIYQSYLGRTPDPNEVNGWVANMQRGMTEEQVAALILSSHEYIVLNGGGGSYIDALYDDVLNRNPTGDPNLEADITDPNGFNFWLHTLRSGASAFSIAYAFVTSYESESLTITAFYQDFLNRTPSLNEINGWVALFNAGTSNVDIRAMFLSSLEYYTTAGKNDNKDWITRLYADLLGRPDNTVTPPVPGPADSEITGWVNFMS
jgi:hypothetical protein